MTRNYSPKPKNFDALTRTWNDPEAFALELAKYYAQLAAAAAPPIDITEPRRAGSRAEDGSAR